MDDVNLLTLKLGRLLIKEAKFKKELLEAKKNGYMEFVRKISKDIIGMHIYNWKLEQQVKSLS